MPADELAERGWRHADSDVETVFSLPAMQVRGATIRYEDSQSHDALKEATGGGVDISVRFLAGTRLTFDPPLPLGVTPKMVEPTLRTEAKNRFSDRLDDRGLTDISRDGSQQIRIDRKRARVTKFDARMPFEGDDLPLTCWIAVWTPRDGPTVVTGAHPSCALSDHFGIDSEEPCLKQSEQEYRDEFFELLRNVE